MVKILVMPKVSVIIPTYNRADYIVEAIESVQAQTFRDVEIIIVDDGSTDGTQAVLQPWIDAGQIRYSRQENRGVSAARNRAIALAQGAYLAFLDSDDLFAPDKLEKQAALLDADSEIGLVHGSFRRVDMDDNLLAERDTSNFSGNVYPEMLLDWSVLIPPSCVMLRAAALIETGGFDQAMRWGEDIDLWRRVARHYHFAAIPEILTTMRVHTENTSVAKADLRAIADFERYLQKALDDDLVLSPKFRRRAWAKLYSNAGHNILAAGQLEQMSAVRAYSLKAIRQNPAQWSAYLGWLASWIGPQMRQKLLVLWRKLR